MPVRVQWHDELDNTLHMHISAPITWEAYHEGIDHLISLASEQASPCSMIFTSETEPPANDIISNFRQSLERLAETDALTQIILVLPQSKHPLGTMLTKLTLRLMGLDPARFVVVDSLQHAVRIAA
jgi:hypothetical protein